MNIMNAAGGITFSIRFQEFTPQENQEKAEIPRNSLADWLTSHGAYPGKHNSCGASVGELLNRFGLRSVLPQSGRDGKNWDTILESARVAPFFQKVPV